MTKREFLRLFAMSMAAVAVRSARAEADRLRVLGDAPLDGHGGPQAGGRPGPEWQRLCESVRPGALRSHGALHVLWLHAGAPAAPLAIATLEEGRARGDLRITERERASVPTLVVDNGGKAHVLMLAGEILLGGKQNRVVAEDVLLPPRSGPVEIAVYCVEQGRWAGPSKHFDAGEVFAAPGLRASVMARAPQARVWGEVGRYAARAGVRSPTADYQALYDKPEVRAHHQEVERALRRPEAGAVGAAVFVGAALGLDLFQDADLFAREWPKLLRAHAVEAHGRSAEDAPDARRLRERVQGLLTKAGGAPGSSHRNGGAGVTFVFRLGDLRGAVLAAEGRVVHAAIL